MMLQSTEGDFAGIAAQGPVVKICGLMLPEHALHAARCGAHMVGMVFAESRRRVSPTEAREIVGALHGSESRPLTVGVFVNESPEVVRQTAEYVGLDAVQLSGGESYTHVWELMQHYPVIKAVRFAPGTDYERARLKLREYKASGLGRLQLLVDAYNPSFYGGTGETSDWALAARLALHESLMLAGGLRPDNVARAVSEVAPWGVDVSSGIEKVEPSGLSRRPVILVWTSPSGRLRSVM